MYTTEVPEARLRGRLGSVSSLFISFGLMWSYVAGALLAWRTSCYVCAVPSLVGFVACLSVPESPYWLMLKGRKDDAAAAFKWLRGPNYDCSKEKADMEEKIMSTGKKMEYRELWRPRTRRPFLIALFLMTIQQGNGSNILIMYTGTVFKSAGVSGHNMAVVYSGLVQVVGTVASVLLMDRVGRRPLMLISTFATGMLTMLLGVCYYLGTVADEAWPEWVALTLVLLALVAHSIGCRCIPWIASAELFNTTIRSTASSVCILYNCFFNFLVVQVRVCFIPVQNIYSLSPL